MRSVFIAGASGFIGSYLYKRFNEGGWKTSGSYLNSSGNGLYRLDITDRVEILNILKSESPEIVCLPAANPDVEFCEENPAETEKINVEGLRNTVSVCKEINARLVYFSSDYIYNGKYGPYAEEDMPDPICTYGKQKLASETIIRDILDDYLIARVTVVYGWEKSGKNFIERLLQSLKDCKEVKVPIDQIGSPTYVKDLADMIFKLAEKNAGGIFNVCGSDLMDRYRFACSAADIFGLDNSCIKPVTTDKLGQNAPRPLNAGMKTDKIENVIAVKPMGVEEGLQQMRETESG